GLEFRRVLFRSGDAAARGDTADPRGAQPRVRRHPVVRGPNPTGPPPSSGAALPSSDPKRPRAEPVLCPGPAAGGPRPLARGGRARTGRAKAWNHVPCRSRGGKDQGAVQIRVLAPLRPPLGS